jgi:hypothetical protein
VPLERFGWSDDGGQVPLKEDGLTIRISVDLPEACSRLRTAFGERSADVWALGPGGAYRLHLPRLWRSVRPAWCGAALSRDGRRLGVTLGKTESAAWAHLSV